MSKLKAKEREALLAEISELRVNVSGLNRRLEYVNVERISLQKGLEDQEEKYAALEEKYVDLLQKHIQMMERYVGMIPRFEEEEEEDDE